MTSYDFFVAMVFLLLFILLQPLDKPQSDQHVTSKMTNYFKPHLQHLATLHLLISSYIRNGGAIGGGNGGAGGLETKLDVSFW